MHKHLTILMVLVLLLFGCVSTIQHVPKVSPNKIDRGKGRIKLTRSKENYGMAIKFRVYDDGKLIGDIGQGGVLEWDTDVGPITLSRDWNITRGMVENNSVSFDVKEGFLYEPYVSWIGFGSKPHDISSQIYGNMLMNFVEEMEKFQNEPYNAETVGTFANSKFCDIYGRIKFVEFGEDYKVKIVDTGGNLKVKYTTMSTKSGQWQLVDVNQDFKIKIVDSFEDFSIEIVSNFEGCP